MKSAVPGDVETYNVIISGLKPAETPSGHSVPSLPFRP